MAKFLVQKSAPLRGEVKISGSKNAVLPIMAAALLTEDKCVIKDTNIIVTDWRAPISSLYYDAEVGKCSFAEVLMIAQMCKKLILIGDETIYPDLLFYHLDWLLLEFHLFVHLYLLLLNL